MEPTLLSRIGDRDERVRLEHGSPEFYTVVEPHRFHAAAHEAANGKIEREHFQFPDFGIWLLEQQVAS